MMFSVRREVAIVAAVVVLFSSAMAQSHERPKHRKHPPAVRRVPSIVHILPDIPRVTLTLGSLALVPGETLDVQWQLDNLPKPRPAWAWRCQTVGRRRTCHWRPAGRMTSDLPSIQVRVRAPGDGALNVVGTQWNRPGVAPPTGQISYLAADGTWRGDAVAFLERARSGRIHLHLPTDLEGAWSVEVVLVDAATGDVHALGARTVVVSRAPGLYLRLNRHIANSLDVVRATLVTTQGETARDVRLVAWLRTPDGRLLGLPDLDPTDLNLDEGPSHTESITLLDRFFEAPDAGAYQVQVRLYDAGTRALIARAGGGFEVCDASSTVTGVVRLEGDVPVGSSARVATAEAFDVDERVIAATAGLDASGAYKMSLAPGRYLLQSTVIDAAGTHVAEPPDVVELGCTPSSSTVNLTTTLVAPTLAKSGGK